MNKSDIKSTKQEVLHMCELLNRYWKNPNELSEDEQKTARGLEKVLEKTAKEHVLTFYRKPQKPGICDECGGRIVKYVQSLFRGRYFYSEPVCDKCNIVYRGEVSPVALGVGDFEKKMKKPFDI